MATSVEIFIPVFSLSDSQPWPKDTVAAAASIAVARRVFMIRKSLIEFGLNCLSASKYRNRRLATDMPDKKNFGDNPGRVENGNDPIIRLLKIKPKILNNPLSSPLMEGSRKEPKRL